MNTFTIYSNDILTKLVRLYDSQQLPVYVQVASGNPVHATFVIVPEKPVSHDSTPEVPDSAVVAEPPVVMMCVPAAGRRQILAAAE